MIRHPEIDKDWIIQNWQSTSKSIKQLSEECNISESLLEARISKYKIRKHFKHQLDTAKLFDLTDPHIWYLAGLAATDGYFPKNQDACTFELVGDSEQELLQSIKEYYNSTQEVRVYKHVDNAYHKGGTVTTCYWRVQVNGLQEFFINNFGIACYNKTFNVATPSLIIDEDCAKAYIRGCLDGDGFISADCKHVVFCTASEKFVNGLAAIIENYTGIPANHAVAHRKTGNYPKISYRTQKAKKVLAWVYSLENCFCLQRKRERYLANIS